MVPVKISTHPITFKSISITSYGIIRESVYKHRNPNINLTLDKIMPKQILTQPELKSLLHYNPDTGIFVRLTKSAFCVNVGDIAGGLSVKGYTVIKVNNRQYRAQRLAFLYMTGSFPKLTVDHINGIKTDNRWNNLRDVSNQENNRNRKLSTTNNSGCVGVLWYKPNNKWVSYIYMNSKRIHLGYFSSFFNAVAARKSADIKYSFHKNHGRTQ